MKILTIPSDISRSLFIEPQRNKENKSPLFVIYVPLGFIKLPRLFLVKFQTSIEDFWNS
jgi:hypothetical protein